MFDVNIKVIKSEARGVTTERFVLNYDLISWILFSNGISMEINNYSY